MDPRTKSTTKKQSSSSTLTTVYLLIYNSVLTIGSVKYFIQKKNIEICIVFFMHSWTLILYEIVKRVLSYNSLRDLGECYGLWNAIEVPLKICQTAAFLEVKIF